jgi:parvulin-like peptidyl-prolyl isomerase
MPQAAAVPIRPWGEQGRSLALALALALALPCATARADDAPPADPVVAQRGTVTLTASQVRALLAGADPETRQQMQRDPRLLLQRVRDRLVQLVLLDRAKADKWDERPDVIYRAEQAKQSAIAESYLAGQTPLPADFPTDQQIAAAYEANKAKLMLPRQYHLAQILVAVPQDAPAADEAQAQKRAADLRRQIVDGHKDFGQVAKQSSDDKTSAPNGGDLGWVRDDLLVPPLRQTLAPLTNGAVSDLVRTPDGWHVVKVLGIRPPAMATLAEAHDTLVRAMRQEREVQMQRKYVADLLQQEPIRIDQVELWKQTAQ